LIKTKHGMVIARADADFIIDNNIKKNEVVFRRRLPAQGGVLRKKVRKNLILTLS